MAEVVGVVAAAGQFIQQSNKIVLFIKAVHGKVQDAPAELKVWRQEIEELEKLVSNVRDSPALQVCVRYLASLISMQLIGFGGRHGRLSGAWRRKEKEIHGLFSQIERFKLTLNTQIAVVNL